MKIHPIKKFKLSKKNQMVLDVLCPKRLTLLLLITIIAFAALIYSFKDELIIKEAVAHAEVIKSPTAVALENFIRNNKSPNTVLDDKSIEQYAKFIIKYSNENKIDPFIIVGLMSVESKFDRYAISSVGALGLTQVMPEWHKDKIKKLVARFGKFDMFEPEHNIALGTMIYAEYKHNHNGNKELALLNYNGSLHHANPTYARKVMDERDKAIKMFKSTMS